MRVLHIYSGNLYGGIETFLVTLARYQHLCPTLEHHFALCFDGRLSRELEEAGATVHRLGQVQVRNPLSLWRARQKLRGILSNKVYDVVACHSAWPQALFGNEAGRAGLPLVFWLHNNTDGKHWLERWAARTKPDMVLCNSEFTASTLQLIYPYTKSEIFYYPISPSKNHSEDERLTIRDELNTPHDTTVIIQVSRMEDWKGHSLHLDALSLLHDLQTWECWMVGGAQRPQEEKYQNKIKSKAKLLGIADRVHFLGQRSDVPKLLAAADIHCQPNTGPEPFGITFIEGLYAGLPVVTTDMGGGREIVDSTCGVLITPKNEKELADVLRKLILNRELRLNLGMAGPARATQLCEPQKQMAQLGEIFMRHLLKKEAA